MSRDVVLQPPDRHLSPPGFDHVTDRKPRKGIFLPQIMNILDYLLQDPYTLWKNGLADSSDFNVLWQKVVSIFILIKII
jgi:hypothetical protein